jgi:hypothetical protein
MKTSFISLISLLLSMPFLMLGQSQQDSTGYPGDNFSLEGAMEIFKKSKSPEDFEKRLNKEKSGVNNLDLNEDGDIDYIRVIDNMDGVAHAIVLQVPVNEDESQDIAVIEIEKTGEESAVLQIIGDAEIYGETIIAEPFAEDDKSGKGNKGGHDDGLSALAVVVNVWIGYPCVKYIYRPDYVVWISPFRWRYYPAWWKPWRPHPWRWHYNNTRVFRVNHRVTTTHRVVSAHRVYTPRRKTSVTVTKKTTTVRVNKGAKGTKVVAGKKSTAARSKGTTGVAAGKKSTKTVKTKKGNKVMAGRKTTTKGVKKSGKKTTVGKKKSTTVAVKKGKKTGAKKTVRRKKN